MGIQADSHSHGTPLRCFRSPAEPSLSCSKREYLYSCAPMSRCNRALGVQGVPCGATGMLPGNIALRAQWSIAPTSTSHFPMALVLSQQVWDVLRSWSGPHWAVQRFLICSAHPAGKIHIVPAHRGWSEPPAWRGAVKPGSPRSRSVSTVGSSSAGDKWLFWGTRTLWQGTKSCSSGGREEIPQLKQKINFRAV